METIRYIKNCYRFLQALVIKLKVGYIMKKILGILSILLMAGCVTVKKNSLGADVRQVSYPEINTTTTAYIGDQLVKKGTMSEEDVLVVYTMRSDFIPPNEYPKIGFDDTNDYYAAIGDLRDKGFQGLSLGKSIDSKLCVILFHGGSECFEGEFERKKRLSKRGNSFQQTLIYSGRVGNKINISYREFSNNNARPAFNNDVEYDLSSSNTIGYKGAILEIINADNSQITYKLIKNFP